jgi:hypothetical protein
MFQFIIGFVIVIMLITMFATYQSAGNPNKNILLNVFLPDEYAKKTEVNKITKAYKKKNQLLLLIFSIVAIPIFFIPYPSIMLLYMAIWFGLYMAVCNHLMMFFSRRLLLLKSKNAWFYGDSMTLNDEKLKTWFLKHHFIDSITDEIYVDDDKYWIKGYYYNPFDKRTMIEKRVGFGTTLNMATKGSKIFNICIIGFITVVLGGVFLLLLSLDFTTFQLSVHNDKVDIKASMYSYEFNISDIEDISLIESLPKKGIRTNGAATDSYMLGNFNLSGTGKAKVYVYRNNPPYIMIKLHDLTIFFNTKSETKTNEIYKMLEDIEYGD